MGWSCKCGGVVGGVEGWRFFGRGGGSPGLVL